MDLDGLMTIDEVATFLRVHKNTVRKMMKSGGLPHFRVHFRSMDMPSAIRFERKRVVNWLKKYEEGSTD